MPKKIVSGSIFLLLHVIISWFYEHIFDFTRGIYIHCHLSVTGDQYQVAIFSQILVTSTIAEK